MWAITYRGCSSLALVLVAVCPLYLLVCRNHHVGVVPQANGRPDGCSQRRHLRRLTGQQSSGVNITGDVSDCCGIWQLVE
jgi:hypothetical protein